MAANRYRKKIILAVSKKLLILFVIPIVPEVHLDEVMLLLTPPSGLLEL